MPNKLSQFWQELKRRRVVRLMAMYGATAYIIMEAADIMLPRLGLPDWTVTLVILLLIIGLPIAIVLSWIFDITPQGVVRTGPMEEEETSAGIGGKPKRKLKLSDGVIAVLLVVVVILVYPKIFGDENSHLRRKMPDQISIAIMPFNNMTGDTIFNLWQGGMQNLLITSLSNSEELSVRQFETMSNLLNGKSNLNLAGLTPALAGEFARKVEANTMISGNLYKSNNKVRITANIMNADTEEIYKSYSLEANEEDDLFGLADSLSWMLKDFLEIKSLKQNQTFDLGYVFTQSPEAYKYYLQGFSCHNRLDYDCAASFYHKAIELDSNFISAMMQLAYCLGDQREVQQSKYWAYKAYERMDHLPLEMQLKVQLVKAVADKDPLKQLDYTRQYLQLHSYSTYMIYMEGWINFNLERWEEAVASFEKSISMLSKIDSKPWGWTFVLLGGAYHHLESHNKEQKIFEEGKELWPEQKSTFDYWQAICAVSRGDTAHANYLLGEIRKVLEQKGWPEGEILEWYAGVYSNGESFKKAEEYYRKSHALRPKNSYLTSELALFLIKNNINLDGGMELITPLAELYPGNASYLYIYGLGLYKLGELQKSQKILQQSWDQKPYYDHKHFLLLKKLDNELASQNARPK